MDRWKGRLKEKFQTAFFLFHLPDIFRSAEILFCEQVSDSRIRPEGCLFVYYFLNGYETFAPTKKQPEGC